MTYAAGAATATANVWRSYSIEYERHRLPLLPVRVCLVLVGGEVPYRTLHRQNDDDVSTKAGDGN